MKRKFFTTIFMASLLLTACDQPKKVEPTAQQKIQEQYKQLMNKTWADLDQTEEKLLRIAYEHGSEGCSIENFRNEQEIVDKFIKMRMLVWDTKALKYYITDFGKGVYEAGVVINAAESQSKKQ